MQYLLFLSLINLNLLIVNSASSCMQCINCPRKYSPESPGCNCHSINPQSLVSVNCDSYWDVYDFSYGSNYTCQTLVSVTKPFTSYVNLCSPVMSLTNTFCNKIINSADRTKIFCCYTNDCNDFAYLISLNSQVNYATRNSIFKLWVIIILNILLLMNFFF